MEDFKMHIGKVLLSILFFIFFLVWVGKALCSDTEVSRDPQQFQVP